MSVAEPVPPLVTVSVPDTFVFAVPRAKVPKAGALAPAEIKGCPEEPAAVIA